MSNDRSSDRLEARAKRSSPRCFWQLLLLLWALLFLGMAPPQPTLSSSSNVMTECTLCVESWCEMLSIYLLLSCICQRASAPISAHVGGRRHLGCQLCGTWVVQSLPSLSILARRKSPLWFTGLSTGGVWSKGQSDVSLPCKAHCGVPGSIQVTLETCSSASVLVPDLGSEAFRSCRIAQSDSVFIILWNLYFLIGIGGVCLSKGGTCSPKLASWLSGVWCGVLLAKVNCLLLTSLHCSAGNHVTWHPLPLRFKLGYRGSC